MSRKIFPAIVLILLSFAALGVAAQAETIIRLPHADIPLQETTTLDAELVCPANNCIGIDVTVAYDPEVIRVDAVTLGDVLGTAARITGSSSDSPGMFRFSALSSAVDARQPEGVVLKLHVTGLALGESELAITSLTIFRRGGTVQATFENGVIEVMESAAPAEQVTLQVSRRLTVRSGPGADFGAAATVQPGAVLDVLGVSADGAWFLVALPGGAQGWLANSRFAVLSADPDALPVVGGMSSESTAEAVIEEPTATPTETASPTAAEPTATETGTEEATPLPTDTATEALTATSEPTNTAQPVKSTEAPTATPIPPTDEPTSTPEPPTATPTYTPLPPTATLRTDTEAQIAPPATDTPDATNTPTPTDTATNTPSPTFTPSPTTTPAPPTPTFTATIPEPCTVTTTQNNVPVSVGPNRVIRTTFPANQSILVTGQQQAADGSLWWRIEPLSGSLEVDRFWVRQSDVTAQGGCDLVADVDSPQVISGGSGTQYAGTFRSGQTFATHTIQIGAAGNYQIVCSGSPTYPVFSLDSSNSQGQTTISTNLAAGRHTLTVFASTTNSGQQVFITSYSCSLSRR